VCASLSRAASPDFRLVYFVLGFKSAARGRLQL
jgi:hypothetical protein